MSIPRSTRTRISPEVPLHSDEAWLLVKLGGAIIGHIMTTGVSCLRRPAEFLEVDCRRSRPQSPQSRSSRCAGGTASRRKDPVVATAIIPKAQVEEVEEAAVAEAEAAPVVAATDEKDADKKDAKKEDKKDDKKADKKADKKK